MTEKTRFSEGGNFFESLDRLGVLLVVPPFADPKMPALGPTLLLAACRRRNIRCQIFYSNLLLAATIGHETYERFCYSSEQFSGEMLFAPYAFDLDKAAIIEALFRKIESLDRNDGRYQAPSLDEYCRADGLLPGFLDEVVRTILEHKPAIVGFGSMMQQNAATAALARCIKQLSPETVTVIGGANATSPMGEALLEIAPMIDYLLSGEADEEFPAFCYNYLQSGVLPSSRVIHCAPVSDLASVEIPVYGEYILQLKEFQDKGLLPRDWPEVLLFESSRGCWWGDRCQCTFCGVNMSDAGYRRKTRERIVREIVHLKDCYNVGLLSATDNVMPTDLGGMFDHLTGLTRDLSLFYEVRPTVTAATLDSLVRGGCSTLQAGVESLSTGVLKKMRKGVTALQNLVLLREAASRLIDLRWNFLLDIPGETEDDYREMAAIIPLIEHLQSPTGWGPVRIVRYSPFFALPEEFGIDRLEPDDMYRYIYPADADISRLADRFHGRYSRLSVGNSELYSQIVEMIRKWAGMWEDTSTRPRLYLTPTTSGLQVVKDTRTVAKEKFTLMTQPTLELLEVLNRPTRHEAVPEELQEHLEDLLDRRFVILYERHYISLVATPMLGIALRDHGKSDQDLHKHRI